MSWVIISGRSAPFTSSSKDKIIAVLFCLSDLTKWRSRLPGHPSQHPLARPLTGSDDRGYQYTLPNIHLLVLRQKVTIEAACTSFLAFTCSSTDRKWRSTFKESQHPLIGSEDRGCQFPLPNNHGAAASPASLATTVAPHTCWDTTVENKAVCDVVKRIVVRSASLEDVAYCRVLAVNNSTFEKRAALLQRVIIRLQLAKETNKKQTNNNTTNNNNKQNKTKQQQNKTKTTTKHKKEF